MLENLQQVQHQQILTDVSLRELVEETSQQLDELYIRLINSRQEIDIDAAIASETINHQKRQVAIMLRHLHVLKEKKAQYGIETPPHLEIQIEEYQAKIESLRVQLQEHE